MIALTTPTPRAVREWTNDFLGLWPHRYDFIVAPFPQDGEKPDWRTESRYPLPDRQLEQGGKLRGVRFGKTTQYCLIDIDAGSPHHPNQSVSALTRLKRALEPLGLARCITCTSSDSGGLHLYFPFKKPQESWKLAVALETALSSKGFTIKAGQLEIFPNAKPYSTSGEISLFNAHRLPLQEPGSHLFNDALEPIFSSQEFFVSLWKQCQKHNEISKKKITKFVKSKRRIKHFISQKADSFLNDLNTDIEAGWTGRGQTNHLLGRITMRCFIFHHVTTGGDPLSGKALIDEIITTAIALPGYKTWCRHQHEIRKRAIDWARCIENSHYFPYGTQKGKYKATKPAKDKPQLESYNDCKAKETQQKINQAMKKLLDSNELPTTITARFRALTQEHHIGGSSLYRYKELWHPKYDQERFEKSQAAFVDEGLPLWEGSPSISTSLFTLNDSNSFDSKDLTSLNTIPVDKGVSNTLNPLSIKALSIEQVREQRLIQQRQKFAQQISEHLEGDDSILLQEALSTVATQPQFLSYEVIQQAIIIAAQKDEVSILLGVFEELLRLRWNPEQIQQELQCLFGQVALTQLSAMELQLFYQMLRTIQPSG